MSQPITPILIAINYLKTKSIVKGFGDGTFKPEATITRSEFTKIVIGAAFSQSDIDGCDTSTLSFNDVLSDNAFRPWICIAKSKSIINGFNDGTFKPWNNITFIEGSQNYQHQLWKYRSNN